MRKLLILLAVSASFGVGPPAAASELVLLRQRLQALEQQVRDLRTYEPIRPTQRLEQVEVRIQGLRLDMQGLRAEVRELRETIDRQQRETGR